jgi:hypothetical protein
MNLPDDGPKVVGFVVGLESRVGTTAPWSAVERSAARGGRARDLFLSFVDSVRDETPCCTSKLISDGPTAPRWWLLFVAPQNNRASGLSVYPHSTATAKR